MFVVVNGYDNAPARPIKDVYDGTYRIKEGAWYGWPDFTANFDPVTDEKYRPVTSAIAPESWGEYADHLFVPEFGDFEWFANPTRDKTAGSRISVISTDGSGKQDVQPFIQNEEPATASQLGKSGEGLERPYDVKFGPDGAMYIVDFSSLRVHLDRIAQGEGHFPVELHPETGIIWRVYKK
jgi:glucose/arabinose dehydrogenase